MKREIIKWLITGMLVLAAGVCYVTGMFGAGGGSKTVITAESGSFTDTSEAVDGDKALENGQAADKQEAESLAEGKTTTAVKIFVHVSGEVISPGVFEMEQGSRIFEAVSRAGGYTEQAAADFLNMAQQLEDGMKITVPDKETARALSEQMEQAGVSGSSSGTVSGKEGASAKVNINTAQKEELMTLSGVGEAKAMDIIAYREQNGPFKKIEDIMKVSGIKEAGFQKIRENITV